MKIKYAFVTTISDEPEAIQNFIDAYESNGSVWDGTIDYDENISDYDINITDYMNNLGTTGYELLLRNTGSSQSTILYRYTPALTDYGLMTITPVGSNKNEYLPYVEYFDASVKCGSGDREVGNATGYPCMFFDKAISENYINIQSIKQCGTPYKISHIRRWSESVLEVKLEGYSTNLIGTGISEHGIPLNFGGLVGSDISPLPSGIKYTSYVIESNNWFLINTDTTSGTIFGAYQPLTDGTIQYGGTDSQNAFIIESVPNGSDYISITLKDITGFDNNPNGIFDVVEFVNQDGFYNKLKITHSLGDGTYGGNGKLLFASQSYSTPTIAGYITDIKISVGGDWTDAVSRAIVTSSNYPNYDSTSGYGYINVQKAKDYIPKDDLDTPVLYYNFVSSYLTLHWTIVPFANEYELWFKNSLLTTIKENNVIYTATFNAPYVNSPKNFFKVRAKNGNKYSEFSNQIEIPLYGAKFIKIK